MKSFNAFFRMVALTVITGFTGCGTSTGPANLTAEEKERQIKELKEQNVSEWGGTGKKKK